MFNTAEDPCTRSVTTCSGGPLSPLLVVRSHIRNQKMHVSCINVMTGLEKHKNKKTETILEAEARREYYRQCTAKTRASETVEQTTECRARNKECTAKKRARESKKESTECRACNKECTAKK